MQDFHTQDGNGTVAAGTHGHTVIVVERGETFHRRGGTGVFRTDYRCVGPDGTVFTNTDKATLKSVLTRHYGKVQLEVIDGPTWRTQPS